MDLFDSLTVDLYDSGCIICEVRDVRRRQLQLQQLLQQHQQTTAAALPSLSSLPPSVITSVAEVSHVLLRPTTQSIVCDSNLIVAANLPPSSSLQQHKSSKLSAASGRGVGDVASQWSAEERAALEGQLAMRTLEPLCLDPSPVVSLVARKVRPFFKLDCDCITVVMMAMFQMEVARQKYNTVPLSRSVRKYSQAGINRKRKLDVVPAASSAGAAGAAVRLHDFFTHLNKRKKVSPQDTLSKHQQMVRAAIRRQQLAGAEPVAPANSAPASTDVSRLARAIHRRQEVNDMTPHTVEEYILETAERGSNRVYHTKLTIFQRVSNEEYMGELYVERDFKENDNKGSTCRFTLGTR